MSKFLVSERLANGKYRDVLTCDSLVSAIAHVATKYHRYSDFDLANEGVRIVDETGSVLFTTRGRNEDVAEEWVLVWSQLYREPVCLIEEKNLGQVRRLLTERWGEFLTMIRVSEYDGPQGQSCQLVEGSDDVREWIVFGGWSLTPVSESTYEGRVLGAWLDGRDIVDVMRVLGDDVPRFVDARRVVEFAESDWLSSYSVDELAFPDLG